MKIVPRLESARRKSNVSTVVYVWIKIEKFPDFGRNLKTPVRYAGFVNCKPLTPIYNG